MEINFDGISQNFLQSLFSPKLWLELVINNQHRADLWVWECWCVRVFFSEEEAARLSSVVVSAEIVTAASLPLQLNCSVSDRSNLSSHKTTKKHKRKRSVDHNTPVKLSLSSELCEFFGDIGDNKSHEVGDQGSNGRACRKTKHKRRAEESKVDKSQTNEPYDDSVGNERHKVSKQGRVDKCERQKHKRRWATNWQAVYWWSEEKGCDDYVKRYYWLPTTGGLKWGMIKDMPTIFIGGKWQIPVYWYLFTYLDTDTHTQPFYGPLAFCPGLPKWAGTRKVKTIIYWSKR